MPGCCAPGDYRRVFSSREARSNARRYRSKGLDPTAKRIVQFLIQRGIKGQTVLEVGGGIGAIQIELLRAGVSRAMNVELSGGYEEVAMELMREAGFEDRVERRIMDFAESAGRVEPADVVVMHRVVCCYPHMNALVSAAAIRARGWLAMTFPTSAWWNRLGVGLVNVWCRVEGCGFRSYIHSPNAIIATAHTEGLDVVFNERGWIWQAVVLERAG